MPEPHRPGHLADQLSGLTGQITFENESAKPTHGWPGVRDTEKVGSRLRWVLDRHEKLLVVARGKVDGWFSPDVHIAVTDRRALFLKDAEFMKEGRVDTELCWSDQAYAKRATEGRHASHGVIFSEGKSKYVVDLAPDLSADAVTGFVREVQYAAAQGAARAKIATKRSDVVAD